VSQKIDLLTIEASLFYKEKKRKIALSHILAFPVSAKLCDHERSRTKVKSTQNKHAFRNLNISMNCNSIPVPGNYMFHKKKIYHLICQGNNLHCYSRNCSALLLY